MILLELTNMRLLLQTYARLISAYYEEDITMDMAELEEAKQTIEPQAFEAQSKLRSLKTDIQVGKLSRAKVLSMAALSPSMS